MSEMVERVAEAIRRMIDKSLPASAYGGAARAAILAMREPPLGMRVLPDDLRAMVKDAGLAPGRVARDVWQAMIDEALK